MTLRLVRDDERADNTLYCDWIACKGRHVPATILVITNYVAPKPSCEECARGCYNFAPDRVRLAPLSEYVDMYAETRQAATATPGQVIAAEPAQPALDPPSASAQCPARKPVSRRAWWIFGIFTAACWLIAFVLHFVGNAASAANPGGDMGTPGGAPAYAFAVILDVAPFVVAGFWAFFRWSDRQIAKLSPAQQAAVTAGLWAAWLAAEHARRERHRNAVAAVQARSAAYKANAAARQHAATQQAILDQLRQQNAGPSPMDRWQPQTGWPQPPDNSHFPNAR